MVSTHPITDLYESLTVIVPAEVVSNGNKSEEAIDNAYCAFQDYVIASLPFELTEDEKANLLGPTGAAEVGPGFSIGDAFGEVEELLGSIGIREAGEVGLLPVFNVDESITVAQLIKSLDRFDIDSLPYDKQNEALKAAFSFRCDVVLMALEFTQRLVTICNDRKEPMQSILEFFEDVRYSEPQLRDFCDALRKNRCIASATKNDDFVYFFSGKGSIPFHRLRWTGKSLGRLTLLIDLLSKDSNPWFKASKIFETRGKNGMFLPANQDNLRKSYYRVNEQDDCNDQREELKRIIGIA